MKEQSVKFNLDNTDKLIEKWSDVIECKGDWEWLASSKTESISDDKKALMAIACEQIEQSVNLQESTTSADVAKYNPILIPVMRRVLPGMIGNEIFGVQPLSTPTGLIFSLRANYSGDLDNDSAVKYDPKNGIFILSGTGAATFSKNDTIVFGTCQTTAGSGTVSTGTVIYQETQQSRSFILTKNLTTVASVSAALAAGTTVYVYKTTGSLTSVVSQVYTNELFFKNILKGFSKQAIATSTEGFTTSINEVGFKIESTSVTAETRKLKTRWTQELEEDLNAVHGMNAEALLTQIATEEVLGGMNREFIDTIDSYALTNALTLNSAFGTFNYATSDGRWEVERYLALGAHLSRVRRRLALENRRGQANFAIITADILSALESTGRFSSVGNDPYVGALCGTFDGMKVYVDTFKLGQEIILGYKGPAAIDAGMFYAPYIPLKVNKGFGQEDNNPRLFFSTRYALAENPFGGNNYYAKVSVSGSLGVAATIH